MRTPILILIPLTVLLATCRKPVTEPVYDSPYDETSETYIPTPGLNTAPVTAVTAISAQSGGVFENDYGKPAAAKGVCWSLEPNPTVQAACTESGAGTTNFTAALTNLLPDTLYHVRAYATNEAGTVYGGQRTFRTRDGMATIAEVTVTDVRARSSSLSSSVTNDGGAAITRKGFVWATRALPTLQDSVASFPGGLGSVTHPLSNLRPGVEYHVRAFTESAARVTYSASIVFTTQTGQPIFSNLGITGVTSNGATISATIDSDGGDALTARGVCYSKEPDPTTEDTYIASGSGIGMFSASITGLTVSTLYYVRAYATNTLSTSYGSQSNFTTLTPPTFDLESNLLAHYLFNGNADDIGPNKNHGIVLSATLASDRFGRANQAFYIDGVNCPTSKGIKLPVKLNDVHNYTISVWAKSFNPNKKHQTLLNSYPHSFISLTFNYFGSYSSMWFGNGVWLTGGPPNDDISWQTDGTKWNSITVVKANNLVTVYQNGILVKSYSFNSASDFGAIEYFIAGAISVNGGSNCYETYHGSLDDIRIYNRALSTAEVATLYELESTPPPLATDEIQDIEGNRYMTVQIGTQRWMTANLKTTRYRDGTTIPNVTNATTWSGLTTGAWANYDNNAANDATFGKLYNWYAVANSAGLCPVGWHVPTDSEWTVLSNFLATDVGFKMKSTSGWDNNGNGSNASGFNGLPGGGRGNNGPFYSVGSHGRFWSSSEYIVQLTWGQTLYFGNRELGRDGFERRNGLSVRCLRD